MKSSIDDIYPAWLAWRWNLDVPKSSRKGIPRGEPLPISGRKFLVAATMVLYPRGKDLKGIADFWEISASLVGKWRSEERFKTLIKQLEEEFARYVLSRMNEKRFLLQLQESCEPDHWSDRVLQIFGHSLAEAIKESTGQEDVFYLIKKMLRTSDVPFLNLQVPELPELLTDKKVDLVVPSRESDEMLAWQDLLSVCLQSLDSHPWGKRGPKPKKARKQEIIKNKVELISAYLHEIGKNAENDPSLVQGLVVGADGQLKKLCEMLNIEWLDFGHYGSLKRSVKSIREKRAL
jgi:hypothetical protein